MLIMKFGNGLLQSGTKSCFIISGKSKFSVLQFKPKKHKTLSQDINTYTGLPFH